MSVRVQILLLDILSKHALLSSGIRVRINQESVIAHRHGLASNRVPGHSC